MIKNRKLRLSLICLFIIFELTCLLLNLCKVPYAGTHLAYFSIIICFIFSIFAFKKETKNLHIIIALLFTYLADSCLVPHFNGSYNGELGLVFFNFAQISYFLFILFRSEKKLWLPHIIVRGCLILAMVIVAVVVLKDKTDFLSIVTVIYFANLICNLAFSIFNFKKDPLIPIGFLLFALCDITTGFNTIINSGYLSISSSSLIYKLAMSDFNFTWLFYQPSQILLTLSAYYCVYSKHSEK